MTYDLGPYICGNPHHALLHHVLGAGGPHYGLPEQPIMREGIALEFGVGDGASLRCISRYLRTVGFDSFQGLPEDWRPGFEEGMFACDPPSDIPNSTLVIGMFEDTLDKWLDTYDGRDRWALVHIDCDLYSSTKAIFDVIGPRIEPGTVLVFDEWWGYPDCEKHEQRAFKEFVDTSTINWEVIGHGVQQWAIRVV